MEYSEFEEKFMSELKDKKKTCINLLEDNKKLVLEYLNRSDNLNYVMEFINRLIEIILTTHKFKVIEKALKHPLLDLVFEEFKKSDVLVRACGTTVNVDAIKWLLTLPVDLMAQDSEGVTALMNASRHRSTEFLVDYLLKKTEYSYILRSDQYGNTALFYAVKNSSIFQKLLQHGMDVSHVNGEGDSLLIYCCKQDAIEAIKMLLERPHINIPYKNEEGKNAPMILVEHGHYKLLKKVLEITPSFDVNAPNQFGDTLVTVFIKSFNSELESLHRQSSPDERVNAIKDYGMMLRMLVGLKCNFNVPIDGDGNTPILFFLFLKDYASCYYLINNDPSIDLSIMNKHGVSASYLLMHMNEEDFTKEMKSYCSYNLLRKAFIHNKTFDFSYMDSNDNNLLIHGIYRNDPIVLYMLNFATTNMLESCNQNHENAILVATKLGNNLMLEKFLTTSNPSLSYDVNQQDHLGNTALHYAVKLKDSTAIKLLLQHKADITISNNDGKTPVMVALEMNDQYLKELLITTSSTDTTEGVEALATSSSSNNGQKPMTQDPLDQALDQYIKNYRVTEYQKDYDYLGQEEFISLYRPLPFYSTLEKWLIEIYTKDLTENKKEFLLEALFFASMSL